MCPKDADRIANILDLDQTWAYTVCPDNIMFIDSYATFLPLFHFSPPDKDEPSILPLLKTGFNRVS